MKNRPKAMLVSVGGAYAAAAYSLNELQPPFICFFVSEQTKKYIKEILGKLDYAPEHYDWIITHAPQNLLECYQVLAEQLPAILTKWDVSPDELGVEFTFGTKPMSVASVLATLDSTSLYYYVGSKDSSGRDRSGIGVVLDGRESIWYQINPWEALAVSARKEIALLFNLGRFADARERAEQLAKRVPVEMQPVYATLAEMIEGYALWDRFEYKKAQRLLYRSVERLRLYVAGRMDPLHATLDHVAENAEFLKRITKNDEDAARMDTLDLIANATRRAKARRYDDAVARLYSALEGMARTRLKYGYDIKTNAVMPEQIPDSLRDDFTRKYQDEDHADIIKLGLQASYQLLAALDDELGKAYQKRQKDLKKVLNARNQSRLAHGTDPIRPETYETMKDIVMDFAGITEKDLPTFPVLTL